MKQTVIRARVEIPEKAKFYAACKKRNETPSEVLRRLMNTYTEKQ